MPELIRPWEEGTVRHDPELAVKRQLVRAISDMHTDVRALAEDNKRLHKMNGRLLLLSFVTLGILLAVTLPFAVNIFLGG